jgi:2-haloacid dehalogenase
MTLLDRVPGGHALVVFDVNETLSDLSPLAETFAGLGAPPDLASTWFAATLRDGFALTVTRIRLAFAQLGADVARTLLAPHADHPEAGADQVLAAFRELPVHADVVEGIEDLRRLHFRLVTLSNGAAAVADALLTRAGIRQHFERLLTVEDAPRWKPAPEAYQLVAETLEVPVDRCLLVASHPWDCHGAVRAGMAAAWVNRTRADYPQSFDPPDLEVEVESIVDLAAQLGAFGA